MSSSLPSDSSQNRGQVLDVVGLTNTSCAVMVMATRLWVRGHMIRNIGNDDWIMTATTLLSLLGMGLVMAGVRHGVGRHTGDVPNDEMEMGLLFDFISQLVFLWGICLAKLSIGTSLLRIASTKFWKRTILGVVIFVIIYTTVTFISLLAQCSNIRAVWDLSIKKNCWPGHVIQTFAYVNFSLNIVSDLIFAIGIPLPMLWNINLTWKTKFSLFFVLGLGCFATFCAVMRITYLGTYGVSNDWLWDTVNLSVWSMVELNVSIIAGSLPSLRPLFKKILGNVHNSNCRTKVYSGHGGTTSRTSKKSTMWQPRNTKFTPSLPTGRSLDDGGSQVQLSEHMQGRNERSQDSFELSSYKVEARITTEAPKSLQRKNTIGGGITKTTTTTVSYDDPRAV